MSQETLYHTVRLFDSAMIKERFSNSKLQLVAITAFLIAAKLEEYYPPSIQCERIASPISEKERLEPTAASFFAEIWWT